MPHYNIEKGVELIDSQRSTGRSKNQDLIDLMLTMDLGDSFTIPVSRRPSFDSVASMLRKRQREAQVAERRFATRKEDNVTVRIWRTE